MEGLAEADERALASLSLDEWLRLWDKAKARHRAASQCVAAIRSDRSPARRVHRPGVRGYAARVSIRSIQAKKMTLIIMTSMILPGTARMPPPTCWSTAAEIPQRRGATAYVG